MNRVFTCEQCGKEFISKKACKNRIPKFCSSKCYGKSIAKMKICKYCGKSFYNYQNKDFCSMECSGKSRLGKKLSSEHKSKLSAAKKGIKGEKHNQWKGDSVGYAALHEWVKREFGSPMTCEFCGKTVDSTRKIHWANISHRYKRERGDWMRLCVSCHKKYDQNYLAKSAA